MCEDIKKIKLESIGRDDVKKMLAPLKVYMKHFAERIDVLEGSLTKSNVERLNVPPNKISSTSEAGSVIEAKISELEKKIG